MPFTKPVRKFALLMHILSSVGWIGAVAAFLVLALAGLTATNPAVVRAVYIAMEPVTWLIIVPLAFASLATGLLLSFGTPWGILRHYWVVFKLVINLLSLPLLLLHARIIDRLAAKATLGNLSAADLHPDRLQLVVASSASLAVLVVATLLSIYKPRGLTPCGCANA
jgi:hypothetical protein